METLAIVVDTMPKIIHDYPMLTFKKDEVLINQDYENSSVYFIVTGDVENSILDKDGNEMHFSNCGHCILGNPFDEVEPMTITAIMDTNVIVVSKKKFILMLKDFEFSRYVVKNLFSQRTIDIKSKEQHWYKPAEQRVMRALVALGSDLVRGSNSSIIKIKKTHHAIGGHCFMERETVTRTIKILEEKYSFIINRGNGYMTIDLHLLLDELGKTESGYMS